MAHCIVLLDSSRAFAHVAWPLLTCALLCPALLVCCVVCAQAKSNLQSCVNFRETAQVIAKVAFKMFLGITAEGHTNENATKRSVAQRSK